MQRTYRYILGIKAGNVSLPDPSEWTYQVGDLDTSGSRDATGLLHRRRVATKINYEFKWTAIEWEMLQTILGAVNAAKFTLTAPNPITFKGQYTGTYYVGDRTGAVKYFHAANRLDNKKYVSDGTHDEIAQFELKLKFIEY